MKITRKSPITDDVTILELNVTPEQMQRYAAGEDLKVVFPQLTSAERQFIECGISPDEWHALQH